MIKSMKILALLTMLILPLIAMPALSQPNFEPLYPAGGYPSQTYTSDPQYVDRSNMDQVLLNGSEGSAVPSDAPLPVTPSSPESLGVQIPSEPTTSYPAPLASETGRVMQTDESSVPGLTMAAGSEPSQSTYSSKAMIVVPPGVESPNKFYISSVPQTSASTRLNSWQPMWLLTSSPGSLWLYEWYPNGQLDAKYMGYLYPGWNKAWFYGDTPGWHILQYYSSGWSNYIYIYVYGWTPVTWNGPGLNLGPLPYYDFWSFEKRFEPRVIEPKPKEYEDRLTRKCDNCPTGVAGGDTTANALSS